MWSNPIGVGMRVLSRDLVLTSAMLFLLRALPVRY
jgi:hypothetical protein